MKYFLFHLFPLSYSSERARNSFNSFRFWPHGKYWRERVGVGEEWRRGQKKGGIPQASETSLSLLSVSHYRGFPVDPLWIPCGCPVGALWIPCGSPVDPLWIPCGSPGVALWIPLELEHKLGVILKRSTGDPL